MLPKALPVFWTDCSSAMVGLRGVLSVPHESTEKHEADSNDDKWEPHGDPAVCSFEFHDREHHADEKEDRSGILEDIDFHRGTI